MHVLKHEEKMKVCVLDIRDVLVDKLHITLFLKIDVFQFSASRGLSPHKLVCVGLKCARACVFNNKKHCSSLMAFCY